MKTSPSLCVSKNQLYVAIVMTFLAMIEFISTAWISDDAAITLRTALNLIHGYGPTFNIDERVQAFTHPLWFFLISGLSLITKNVFASTFILSIGLSTATIWILCTRVATDTKTAIIGASALMLSRAFVDYSTSGLENPLSHVLLTMLAIVSIRTHESSRFQNILFSFLLVSALYLTRPDLPLLAIPLAIAFMGKHDSSKSAIVGAIVIALIPIVLWTGFSLFYFGFPFPNTAYAKLDHGIPRHEILLQGLRYMADSLMRDPITLTIMVSVVWNYSRSSKVYLSMVAGIFAYVAYVIIVGGDFMSGRFMAAPLLIAVIIFMRQTEHPRYFRNLVLICAVFGALNLNKTFLSDLRFSETYIPSSGIADERGFYFQKYSLLSSPRGTFTEPQWIQGDRSIFIICGQLGFTSIRNGPSTHLIDTCGLADPLLARLPAKPNKDWRIGHFEREIPAGYEATIATGTNMLKDQSMKDYYNSISLITRGPLTSPERLQEIIKFNLGGVKKPALD